MIASSFNTQRFSFVLRRTISRSLLSSSTQHTDNTVFMKLAIRQAQHAFRQRETPVGAVLVDKTGMVVATSRNRVVESGDSTSLAAVNCIRKALLAGIKPCISDCTLFLTLEPCTLSMGAIQASQIKRLVYGSKDPCRGAVDSGSPSLAVNIEVTGGVLAEESDLLLRRFLQSKPAGSKPSVSVETYANVEH